MVDLQRSKTLTGNTGHYEISCSFSQRNYAPNFKVLYLKSAAVVVSQLGYICRKTEVKQ